ncbi:MAG: ABC transporter permease [Bryobacteraceae bacterium]
MLADFRFGVRMAMRSPVWAAAIIVSLAVGIGATVTVSSAVQALLLYRIPAPDRQRLVDMQNTIGGRGVEQNLADARRIREGAAPFAQVAAYTNAQGFHLGNERVWGQLVTENYFPAIGLRPLAGRFINDASDSQVVVLGEAFWRRRFNGNFDVIGQPLSLNGRPVTIIGIAPGTFRGVRAGFLPALWVPLAAAPVLLPNSFPREEPGIGVSVFARLRPGLSLAQAQAAMDTLTKRIDLQFPIPEFWPMEGERHLRLEPAGQFLPNFRELAELLLKLLSAMAAFVLLIACANAANLQLARAAAREREMATRRALGATRGRLVRQLTIESLSLGLAGGAAGLALAHVPLRALTTFRLPDLAAVLDLSMPIDWRVAVFAAVLTVAATLASGLVAAWKGTSPSPGNHRLRDGLVIAQIALSVVLAVATGLLIRSLLNARKIDVGFHPEQAILAQFDPLLEGYQPRQLEPLVRKLLQTPGAAVTDTVPLTMGGYAVDLGLDKNFPFVSLYSVTRGFFDALGIAIIEGRDFAAVGDKGRVLINRTLARQLFQNRSPIGRRIGKKGEYEVIGVAANHATFFVAEDPAPIVYQPLFQEEPRGALTLAVRSGQLPAAGVTFFNIRTGSQQLQAALFVPRVTAALVTAFGAMGLMLTAIGLYALMAYTVSRRMRELGIRVALGARPFDVTKTVFRRTAALVAAGVSLGLLAAYWIAEFLDSILYGLSAWDPSTYALAATVFLVTAAFASWLPARRASTNEPIEALRRE